jgi:hypothetical protein
VEFARRIIRNIQYRVGGVAVDILCSNEAARENARRNRCYTEQRYSRSRCGGIAPIVLSQLGLSGASETLNVPIATRRWRPHSLGVLLAIMKELPNEITWPEGLTHDRI